VAHSPNHHEDGDDDYLLSDIVNSEDNSFAIVSILPFLGHRMHLCASLTLSGKLLR
jgi:hypothetical protein